MEEYLSGKKPTRIFREAGFDVKILGSKRIERAAANWKESYNANSLGLYEDRQFQNHKKKSEKEEENQVKIAELMKEVELLKKQVGVLSSLISAEH